MWWEVLAGWAMRVARAMYCWFACCCLDAFDDNKAGEGVGLESGAWCVTVEVRRLGTCRKEEEEEECGRWAVGSLAGLAPPVPAHTTPE